MRLSVIIYSLLFSFLLCSCGIYNKYEHKSETPKELFGTNVSTDNDVSLAQMTWREFFTDPYLQQLIDSVLARNTDINSVRLAIEQSEASLKAAKLAYLPSL